LVVGLPLDVDDSETDATAPALRFSRQLEGRFHLKVHLADERYTSFEARDRLGHKAKRWEDYDAVAAKLILETWLLANEH
jgi:putative Holliday junction resolvase